MSALKGITRATNSFLKMFGFEIVKYEKEKGIPVADAILHNSKEKINEFYSKENFLDTYVGPSRMNFYKDVVGLLKSKGIDLSNSAVVDVGCGTGHLLHFISKELGFRKGTGLEYSAEAIKIARQLFSSFEFYEYDITAHWEHKYDFILCTEVLEHLLHPEIALKNLKNMMTEKAKVLITVPNGRLDTFGGHINFWSPESWNVFIEDNVNGHAFETGNVGDELFALIHGS